MEFPYKVNVCYVINSSGRVLLQKKARGFGQGKWNGPGGKIKPGETPEQAVKREVNEETGIVLHKPEKAGEIEFIFTRDESWNNYMHVFLCRDWSGQPHDRGEGELRWFDMDRLPYERMWDDDKYWLPLVLGGGKVHMRFYFDSEGKVIKHKDLK